MEVYFDYVYDGKNIVVGVLIKDGKEELEFVTRELEGFGNPQKYNLDYSLLAFKEAIKVVSEYGLDDVTFMNQNQYVFEWVINMQYDKREVIEDIVRDLTNLVKEEIGCTYEIIKARDNGVKKKLKGKVNVRAKGDFKKLIVSQDEEIYNLKGKDMEEYKTLMLKVKHNRR